MTANHFWLDGIGGLVVFSVGSLLGWGLHRWNQNRLDRREMLDALLNERSGVRQRGFGIGSVASEIIDDVSSEADFVERSAADIVEQSGTDIVERDSESPI